MHLYRRPCLTSCRDLSSTTCFHLVVMACAQCTRSQGWRLRRTGCRVLRCYKYVREPAPHPRLPRPTNRRLNVLHPPSTPSPSKENTYPSQSTLSNHRWQEPRQNSAQQIELLQCPPPLDAEPNPGWPLGELARSLFARPRGIHSLSSSPGWHAPGEMHPSNHRGICKPKAGRSTVMPAAFGV